MNAFTRRAQEDARIAADAFADSFFDDLIDFDFVDEIDEDDEDIEVLRELLAASGTINGTRVG